MSEGPINSGQRWRTPDELKAGATDMVAWDLNDISGHAVTLNWGVVSGNYQLRRWRGGIKILHSSAHETIEAAREEFDRQVIAMMADKAAEILTGG